MHDNICKSNKLKRLRIFVLLLLLVEEEGFFHSSQLGDMGSNQVLSPTGDFFFILHIIMPVLNVQLQNGILAYKAYQFDWVGYKVLYLCTHLYTVFITTASGSLALLKKHN